MNFKKCYKEIEKTYPELLQTSFNLWDTPVEERKRIIQDEINEALENGKPQDAQALRQFFEMEVPSSRR